jgi:hypothetical protein
MSDDQKEWMASGGPIHPLYKPSLNVGAGDGQTQVIDTQHYVSRITALEAENAQLRAERDGARAAMAKEAAEAARGPVKARNEEGKIIYRGDDTENWSPDGDYGKGREAAAQAILALADLPAGYVCVKVEDLLALCDDQDALAHMQYPARDQYPVNATKHKRDTEISTRLRAMITKATP